MDRSTWPTVDDYLARALRLGDDATRRAAEHSVAAGLPDIRVSAAQGKLLMVLGLSRGARRILEIGTLGGYSTIWLARSLAPGGRLVSLELKPEHARVARENLERAGVADRVEVREGPAADSLQRLRDEQGDPFDLIFIDADKPSNPEYLDSAIALARPGALILIDNVVRQGRVADPSDDDAAVAATRSLHEILGADPRVEATVIQTVGAKGYDGFALATVLDRGPTADTPRPEEPSQ